MDDLSHKTNITSIELPLGNTPKVATGKKYKNALDVIRCNFVPSVFITFGNIDFKTINVSYKILFYIKEFIALKEQLSFIADLVS